MPSRKIKIGDKEIEIHYENPPQIPVEWVDIIRKLHPITAIVVWAILTGNLTGEIISLAQYSPDWDKYTSIRIVGGGNPSLALEVAEMAQQDLDEIFDDLLPGNTSTRILQ